MESTKPTNSDSSTEFIFLNKHSFHNKNASKPWILILPTNAKIPYKII